MYDNVFFLIPLVFPCTAGAPDKLLKAYLALAQQT